MTLQERLRRRFSENFKKEIVIDLELGKLTLQQVSLAYEVRQSNVKRWVEKYGKEPMPKGILIQSRDEINKLKDLEREAKKLKQIIGEQQIKIIYLEQCMRLATDKLGNDFEKKTK
ncbi:MAG: transposase [Saprospiraceae bacterium]|nr:transposase [Saprospiraceae bacterium]